MRHSPAFYLANFIMRKEKKMMQGCRDFTNQLDKMLNDNCGNVGLLMLDLDRFRLVSEAAGHNVGEEILVQVAERLINTAPPDGIWGNCWGDKFFLAMPLYKGEEELRKVAGSLQEACRRSWMAGGREFYISLSAGAALHPEHGAKAEELMKNSNIALSQAKERGHGKIQLYSSLFSGRMQEKMRIEEALRRTLDRNSQEFFFHFQPRIDLRTGEVNSLEALIRWNSSEMGLLFPADFIAVAESGGLIGKIDQWVLGAACRQIADWGSAGYYVRLSVNISAEQFYNKTFATVICDTIKHFKISPTQLELEITETMVMQDLKTAGETIEKLKDMGLQVALDDFGTGYSSLTNVRELPIDRLKIDQNFISEINSSPKNLAILQAIISLGNVLEVKVTAEGVETEKQLASLLRCGCDEIQGYYFARPVEASKVCRILQSGNESIRRFRDSITMGSSSL